MHRNLVLNVFQSTLKFLQGLRGRHVLEEPQCLAELKWEKLKFLKAVRRGFDQIYLPTSKNQGGTQLVRYELGLLNSCPSGFRRNLVQPIDHNGANFKPFPDFWRLKVTIEKFIGVSTFEDVFGGYEERDPRRLLLGFSFVKRICCVAKELHGEFRQRA